MQKLAITTLLTVLLSLVSGYPQHQAQIDPSYLQQYYAQVAQAARARTGALATPIYEQDNAANQQPQYIAQAQQIRVKDTAQEQARAQLQQKYVAPSVRQYLQQQPQVKYAPPPQQQLQYNQQPAKQTVALQRPIPAQAQYQSQKYNQDEDDEIDQNPSYQFGFDVKDDEFTNYQNRKEVRDGNVIKGSYSVVDSDGFIRTVTYTADPKEGFKAEVVREPTDIVVKIPTQAPQTISAQRNHHHQAQPQQYAQQPTAYRLPQQHQQHQHQQRQQQQQQQQQQHQQQQQYQYE